MAETGQATGTDWPRGGGAMGDLIRRWDWTATALGPVDNWAASLRAAVDLALGCAFPMVVLWGPDLAQVYNDGYRTIMGDKHPAGLGQPTRGSWPEVWHLNAPIYAQVRDGATVTLDDTLYPITRHGYREDAYFTLCYSPLRDVAGAIAGVLVTVFETTAAVRGRALEAERARLVAALAAGETRLLEQVFRRSPAFLHVLRGPDLVFELANDAYYQLVGHRELLGLPALVALPEAAAGGFLERLAHVLATGAPFIGRELPVMLARTPGAPPEERLIDLVYLPLHDADGACTRVLGHGVDVTEQVRARREVEAAERAAREEAEAAVRARDTFLTIAAHELRTPLTALRGTVELALRRQARGALDPGRLDRTLHSLDHATDRLVALTGDLLDVARIQTGQLPLDLRPTDLIGLVAATVERERERAGDAWQLTVEAPAALPPVPADEARIEQVLTNLLDNALKYSRGAGRVVVTVAAEGTGVAITVQDHGIGLPPGAEEAIFAPFGRAANAAASGLPGLGLGLHICRTIVERHGGWIRATSAGEGRGTMITFWLPRAAPPGAG